MRAPAVLLAIVVSAASPASASGDRYRDKQWGLERVRAAGAWPVARGAGVVIAVLDTGVDAQHEDLRDKLLPGRDFTGGTGDAQDLNGHGTAVAGIAAAATDNGLGIAGVAPDAKILPLRVLDATGAGNEPAVAAAIDYASAWAADMRTKLVIELAFADVPGVRPSSSGGRSMVDAVRRANERGAVVVFADAASPYRDQVRDASIWAGATDASDARVPYPGSPDVLAPGDRLITTAYSPVRPAVHDAYSCPDPACASGTASGTSYAASHVAGVAALLLSSGLTNLQSVERLLQSAEPVRGSSAGRVDAARAIGTEDARPSPVPSAAVTPAPTVAPAPAQAAADPKVAAPASPPPAAGSQPTAISQRLPPGGSERTSERLLGRPIVLASAVWLAVFMLLLGVGLWWVRDRPSIAPPVRARHRPAFDGLRGVAVLWVVALHATAKWRPAGKGMPALLWPFMSGALGVDVFFVLSGFLLVQSWESVRTRARTAGRAIAEFATRRAMRIMPAFLVALGVLIPIRAMDLLRSPRDLALFVTVQQHLVPGLPWAVDGPTWSLTPEVHFYLLLPVLAFALRRLGPARVVGATFVLSLAWRVYTQDGDLWPANFLFGRIDQFAAGMAGGLAVAAARPGRIVRLLRTRAAGMSLLAGFVVLAVSHGRFYGITRTGLSRAEEIFVHPAAGLALAALFVRAAGSPGRVLESGVLRFFGLISYSLYLWHVALLDAVKPSGAGLAGALAASVAVACVSYALVERPALRARRAGKPHARPGVRPAARIGVGVIRTRTGAAVGSRATQGP